MDQKQEMELRMEVRQYLIQIALELEAAAGGAKGAAENIGDRELAIPYVQQLYSRLSQATYLLDSFKRTIDKAINSDKKAEQKG